MTSRHSSASSTRWAIAGIYSFDVYNDDYQQMPPDAVVSRARRAAEWLEETVLRRALPVPNIEHLRRTAED